MNNMAKLRRLGNSDLMVTPVGLGCWQFSKQENAAGKFWPYLEDDLILKIVATSVEGGINWFDTAEIYGGGASEKALSKSLQANGKKPGDVIVATKWWPLFRTASNIPKTIGKRLDALSPFPVDLYQVHQPYGFSGEKAEMEAMAKLVKEHKIRYVGVSNFPAAKMRSAWNVLQKHGISLVSNQVRYSLLDRSIEYNGILHAAKELGITIIAYSPLAQGLVTGKFHEKPELVRNAGLRKYTSLFKTSGLERSADLVRTVMKIAGKYDVSTSQVALSWLINIHGTTVVAIPGATKESQAIDNAKAMNFRLSDEDMELLDRMSTEFRAK
jgi:aryl-alcohol dehydrogenase-like predicted oxidoreductase